LDALLSAVPAPTRTGRVVIGCPPGENHTFGPLLIVFLLRRRGWNVVYLGADVPIHRLHATLVSTRPDLVLFSAQLLETAASLLDVALHLQEKKAVIAYGGRVFNRIPDLRRRIPGHFLGTELSHVPPVVEHLITARPALAPIEPPTQAYQQALERFRENSGLLQTHVWQALNRLGIAAYDLNHVHDYLTRGIAAALRLGDLNYLNADLNWVEGLIRNFNLPVEQLTGYMGLYAEAAAQYFTMPDGRLIAEWLAETAERTRALTDVS
jgi:hypothetical protein